MKSKARNLHIFRAKPRGPDTNVDQVQVAVVALISQNSLEHA